VAALTRPDEMRALADRQAIHDMILRYCRGADRADRGLMLAAYHSGAHDHHGAFSGLASDFVDQYIDSIRTTQSFVMHHVGNVLIELDGDRATSEAYFVAYLGDITDDRRIDVLGGRYVDRWEHREGRWGIVHRVVVHDWSRSDDIGPRPFTRPSEAFAQGDWWPIDPIYQPEPGEERS
jgi:hypothetical protein